MKLTPQLILYEDNHLLVVNKPTGLATMGTSAGEDSVVVASKAYLKVKYRKPGNVYLGVVSRLDRHVSGVLVLARTSKAAARLAAQFLARGVEKTYWALVTPPPQGSSAALTDWLIKDERRQRMVVVPRERPGAQEARLSFSVRGRHRDCGWLEVNLETGRKHQIRVQLAHHHWPVIGDVKYGSVSTFPAGIALHARQLAFDHPVREERLTFAAPLPPAWEQFRRQRGWAVDGPE